MLDGKIELKYCQIVYLHGNYFFGLDDSEDLKVEYTIVLKNRWCFKNDFT